MESTFGVLHADKNIVQQGLAAVILGIGVEITSCNIAAKGFDYIIIKIYANLLPRVQSCSFALELFRLL
jgi:hypothetical protein